MRFSAEEEIEAPIDAVFDMVTDFATFEEAAARHGAEVRRTDALDAPGIGMSWDASFELREKRRQVALTVSEFDRPTGLELQGSSEGLAGTVTVDLVALSRSRTRMAVAAEVKPKTLGARVLLQSMKLAKGRLDTGFRERVAAYAAAIEERCQRPV